MRTTTAIALVMAMMAGPAFADCTAPNDSIIIPNGAAATMNEMVAAQNAVRELDKAVAAYSDCLKQEEDAKVAAGADKAKIHPNYVKLNNDSVTRLQQVASKFNEELRAFKAKSPH